MTLNSRMIYHLMMLAEGFFKLNEL